MFYFGLAFSAAWVVYFGYLFYLDRQIRALRQRLQAREAGLRPESR